MYVYKALLASAASEHLILSEEAQSTSRNGAMDRGKIFSVFLFFDGFRRLANVRWKFTDSDSKQW
jgi:hypothetical protein